MDDERLIRDVTGEMLIALGFQVKFANDGFEAVDLIRKAKECGERFEAVILDLTVPGSMGGKQAIGKILEIDPSVKAIVSSGYSNDPVLSNFREYGFRGAVSKPYRIRELSNTLQEVLFANNNPTLTELSG
jgi:CheY-like chemotaxis protein